MAFVNSTISTYMQQWVKTATEGRVEVEFAWFADRMMLYCHRCCEKGTFPKPQDDTTIDDDIKVFVNRHAHCERPTFQKDSDKVVPLTADFKNVKVPPFNGEQCKGEIEKFGKQFAAAKPSAEELEKRAEQMKAENAKKIAEIKKASQDNDLELAKIAAQLEQLQGVAAYKTKVVPAAPVTIKSEEKAKAKTATITTGRKFR